MVTITVSVPILPLEVLALALVATVTLNPTVQVGVLLETQQSTGSVSKTGSISVWCTYNKRVVDVAFTATTCSCGQATSKIGHRRYAICVPVHLGSELKVHATVSVGCICQDSYGRKLQHQRTAVVLQCLGSTNLGVLGLDCHLTLNIVCLGPEAILVTGCSCGHMLQWGAGLVLGVSSAPAACNARLVWLGRVVGNLGVARGALLLDSVRAILRAAIACSRPSAPAQKSIQLAERIH